MTLHDDIFRDRMEGRSFSQIAQDRFLGTAQIASSKLSESLELQKQPRAQELLYLELARLEELHRLYWPDAQSGSIQAPRIINSLIATRAKILVELHQEEQKVIDEPERSHDLNEMVQKVSFYLDHEEEFLQWLHGQTPHWEQLEFPTA
jgi:hypothetical protein